MYYNIIYLAVSPSELYLFKKKVSRDQYYSIFKYMDILVSTKNISGVHYSNILQIFNSLRDTGSVVVNFDSDSDKSTQILKFFNLFILNRTTENLQCHQNHSYKNGQSQNATS